VLAEAVGFEPTERFPVRSVSNRVLSASQPRLRRALSSHPRERGQEGKGGIATIQDAPRRLHQSVQGVSERAARTPDRHRRTPVPFAIPYPVAQTG
jgi:hypothetical protein